MFHVCALSCNRSANILWNFIKLKLAFLHFALCCFLLALWSCHIFSYLTFAFQSMKNSQAPDYSLQVANGETRSDHSPFYLVCWRKVDFHEGPPMRNKSLRTGPPGICATSLCAGSSTYWGPQRLTKSWGLPKNPHSILHQRPFLVFTRWEATKTKQQDSCYLPYFLLQQELYPLKCHFMVDLKSSFK